MTMAGYTKLFSKILNSSIWNEDDKTRILWVTILAMSDQHGYVEASAGALAHQARITRDEFDASILKLESPDPDSSSDDYEGRRVSKVDGGWIVLNYTKYRSKLLNTKENEQARERMRKHRAKLKGEEYTEEEANTEAGLRNVTQGVKYTDSFIAFWQAYPKKKSKGDAFKAWKQQKPNLDDVLAALKWQVKQTDWLKDGGQFVPYPGTYIRARGWEDEKTDAKKQPGTVNGAVI